MEDTTMRKSLRHLLLTAAGITALFAGIASNTFASSASEDPCIDCEDQFWLCGGWQDDYCVNRYYRCLALNGCPRPPEAAGNSAGQGAVRGRETPGGVG
jgi:hypothetical protein